MRKGLSIFTMLSGLLFLAGCGEPVETFLAEGQPVVVLTLKEGVSTDRFTVTFRPVDAARFEYSIKKEGATAPDGEPIRVDKDTETDVEFPGLSARTLYLISARAFDAEGNGGPVASLRVSTTGALAGAPHAEVQYLTNNSAGLEIHSTYDFHKFDYAVGTASDMAAFEAGTLEGIRTREESTLYVVNAFDLSPATEYTLFVRGYDRADNPVPVVSLPFTTAADGACPAVTFEVAEADVFEGTYKYIPNSLCGKMVVLVTVPEGSDEQVMDDEMSWYGNAMAMLDTWAGIGMAVTVEDGETYTHIQGTPGADPWMPDYLMNWVTPMLETDYKYVSYVLLYDTDDQPFGVQRIRYSTPAYDSSLAKASVTATAGNITANGATLEFTLSPGTVGFLFDTVDADWYDAFKANGTDDYGNQWHKNYLRDMFIERGSFWRHHKNPDAYTDTSMTPGTKFYIAICPMNGNGVSDPDWGELWLSPAYTTLSN